MHPLVAELTALGAELSGAAAVALINGHFFLAALRRDGHFGDLGDAAMPFGDKRPSNAGAAPRA